MRRHSARRTSEQEEKRNSPVLIDDFGSIKHFNVHFDSVPPVTKYSSYLHWISRLIPLGELGVGVMRSSAEVKVSSARFIRKMTLTLSSPQAEDMEGDVLERVLLKLVVRFENTPDWKNVSAAEVESTRLVESPSICFLVSKLAGICGLDST